MLVALCGALGACSGGDHEDLKQWMVESTKDMRGSVPKVPEVLPYQPVPYEVEGVLDPFKPNKIEPESKYKQAAGKGGAFQPDFEAREMRNSLLEKYPIESLKMIGYLNINNRPMAAIQVDDKVKQVKVGDYIGLDFGMVTQITDKEVELRELIQDSAGDWSERKSSLYLQSKEGSKK
ncbi:pilus assembly protein PilP [Dechloromonas denitrificans]|jgi:type IV pilus assembly protein PilP|uniref:pilus assembly protein PilP n=1 Tax=Azonexaceae TaxID=2008795 RepID=UPI001CF868A9|nr:pilus assembly protein PilP [Dechloromonas denitrificans]UCV03934.1 pilus assembly protein PilP [Dechloromonas denitrificans]UCV08190.1 pilus assembly protein PilP [Dechloromonas denitrificans]